MASLCPAWTLHRQRDKWVLTPRPCSVSQAILWYGTVSSWRKGLLFNSMYYYLKMIAFESYTRHCLARFKYCYSTCIKIILQMKERGHGEVK